MENCKYCGKENPKKGMKTCSRKCNDELKRINSREKRKCLFCHGEFEVRKKESKIMCSEACRKKHASIQENIDSRIKLSKLAVKEKFGVDNIFQLETTKSKSKKTKKEKYGDENYNNFNKNLLTKKGLYGDNYGKEWYKKMEKKLIENHGVKHGLQVDEFLKKQKVTNLEKYGVEYVSQNESIKQKIKDTTFERFGVEYASQNQDIQKKIRETSMKNFGVTHHLKNNEMFQKHQKARFKIKSYKGTEINYNGSYELYFLELLEGKGLLNEIKPGQSFEYFINNTSHIYHTDFTFKGKQIEIKSGWTYNKNGKDKELQNINDLKWAAARLKADLIILIGKDEIKGFIKAL